MEKEINIDYKINQLLINYSPQAGAYVRYEPSLLQMW